MNSNIPNIRVFALIIPSVLNVAIMGYLLNQFMKIAEPHPYHLYGLMGIFIIICLFYLIGLRVMFSKEEKLIGK